MQEARGRTAPGRSWCRAALQDLVSAFGGEIGVMWEALTWLAADALCARPSLATATEQAIATMDSAAARWNALADWTGPGGAGRNPHGRAGSSCTALGGPAWPDGDNNAGR